MKELLACAKNEPGQSTRQLARKFDLSKSTVHKILQQNLSNDKNVTGDDHLKSSAEPENKQYNDTGTETKAKYIEFECDVCPKKFVKKHRYEAHKRTHLGLKQWKCEHCDKEFTKYYTLCTHMKARHYDESSGPPKYVCDIEGCGKVYSIKVSRKYFATNLKPFFTKYVFKMDYCLCFIAISCQSSAHHAYGEKTSAGRTKNL